MGGDGGVIPKNRQYLRGAGDAKKTGHQHQHNQQGVVDPQVRQEERARALRQCAISQQALDLSGQSSSSSSTIVACPYGRLYVKEAIVEALLKRKQQQSTSSDPRLDHIRGLKDLYPVRFQVIQSDNGDASDVVPVCPVRGIELNGQVPAVILSPGKVADDNNAVNVVSERALTELGSEAIAQEYGPVEKTIPLLPTDAQLTKLKAELAEQKKHKKSHSKKDKKRKRSAAVTTTTKNKETTTASTLTKTVAVSTKQTTTSSNKVLQSLFVDPSKSRESADTLFARS